MANPAYNLAIETSSRQGAIALGRGDQMLCEMQLPTPRRHRVDLMPAIAALCEQHQIKPAGIGEIYVCIGPGSFTGLRIAVTTAKVISHITGAKIVAVPTLDVVAQNAQPSNNILAVALNAKHQTVYGGCFLHNGQYWSPISKPQVQTLEQLLNAGEIPGTKVQLLGEIPQEVQKTTPQYQKASPNFRGQVESVWQIGQRLASQSQYTDAYALVPLYAREPEAVTLWEQNKNKRVTCS